jgi:hypothetical protein
MEAIPTIEISSWRQYLSRIKSFQHCAFRGVTSAVIPLRAAIQRYFADFKIDPKVWQSQEKPIIRIFKRKVGNYLDKYTGWERRL